MRITRAEALCWVARLASSESEALAYAWPPSERDYDEAERLRDVADAAHSAAVAMDDSPDLWRRATAKWEAE